MTEMSSSTTQIVTTRRQRNQFISWPHLRSSLIWLVAVAAIGLAASHLLEVQAGKSAADALRYTTLFLAITISAHGLFVQNSNESALRHTGLFLSILLAGQLAAEAAVRLGSVSLGTLFLGFAAAAAGRHAWRAFSSTPQLRPLATWLTSTAGVAAVIAFLARHDQLLLATAFTGITGMVIGCFAGLAGVRALLSSPNGTFAVARVTIDEAVRMRAALLLLVLLVVLIPTLPLALDHTERLEYRVQFFLSWSLGSASLILSLLTIVFTSSSICGDIESFRIHMTLAKPLQRWEYLLGKWLGVMIFNFILVGLTGIGTYTFAKTLAGTQATDAIDREAVDQHILAARTAVTPSPASPTEREQAIEAAINKLEQDAPDYFRNNPAAARSRVRFEYDWAWHTVAPDMVSTYVFHNLESAKARNAPLQLQLKPRVNNVEIDLAEVRFAMWLNGRPWPMQDGVHLAQTLPSQADHIFSLPPDVIDEEGNLEITFENKNLVSAGATIPSAITFSPGDGLRLLYRAGSFRGNVLKCLAVILMKLSLVAAASIAAASFLGSSTALLLALSIYFGAMGSGFIRDALMQYNIAAGSFLGVVTGRMSAAWELFLSGRFYEAGRMLLGFVTDFVLAILPAFSNYDAIGSVANGLLFPLNDLVACCALIGVAYPLGFGLVGWAGLARRDLLPSTT